MATTGEDSAVMSIPAVEFVTDVDAFMADAEHDNNAQMVLRKLDETYNKLKITEVNNLNTKRRLKTQITEFENSLRMLEELKKRREDSKDMTTHFRLADHVFAFAKVPPTDKIGLWLGASVMLEYSLDEGESILKEKLEKAERSLETTNHLIDRIRENVTTMEVNMARVYNWDVKRRQVEKEKAMGKAS